MRNILLIIEYDGTEFCGWQIQPNGYSVQQCISEALEKLDGEAVMLVGSGRTDAGVHARGQAASFNTCSRIPAEKYADALNSQLPESIRIIESKEVPQEFNARFSAKKKTYKYRIRTGNTASALNARYEYFYRGKLNIEEMQKACLFIAGEHDFSAFMASGSSISDTVRTVYEARIVQNGNEMEFTVTGNGFLYKMVRLLVGTLIEIGAGRHNAEYMKQLVEGGGSKKATFAAAAKGLVLHSVEYE